MYDNDCSMASVMALVDGIVVVQVGDDVFGWVGEGLGQY